VGMTLRPPFLFARLLGLRPEFFWRTGIIFFSRPCPTRPVRGRQKGTPFLLD